MYIQDEQIEIIHMCNDHYKKGFVELLRGGMAWPAPATPCE